MLKRFFDIFLSGIGIISSLPLWVAFSLAILFEEGRPVFYRHDHVGKNGRIFKALKFRSMINDAEKDLGPVQTVENDPRVTEIGKFSGLLSNYLI